MSNSSTSSKVYDSRISRIIPNRRRPITTALLGTFIILIFAFINVTASPIKKSQLETDVLISYGETISGSISSAVEVDSYTFNGNSGDQFVARVVVTSGDLDPEIFVYRPDSTSICSNTTLGNFVEENCILDTSGTHTISVAALNAASVGSYDLYIQRSNNAANALPLYFDETSSGSISPSVELDAYQFSEPSIQTITPNGPYQIFLPYLAGRITFRDQVLFRMELTAGSMDPEFRVYRPDGSLLCSGATLGDFVETLCSVDTNGLLNILAGALNGNSTGSFNIYVQSTINPVNAVPIPFDETKSGSISPAVDLDAYTFNASTGDLVMVRMDLTAGSMDPQFRVYRPDGSLLCSGSSLGDFAETLCNIDRDGAHKILVGAYNANDTGNYDVYIQRTNKPANPTQIAYDETQSASVSPAVDLDAYTFEASSGDLTLVRMDLTAGSMDPQFRVYRPDGSLLCSGSTLGDFVETLCSVDTNGIHTLLVGAYNANATGNYDVYIQRTNNPANPTPIAYDETQSSSVSPAVDLDAYSFDATSGDLTLVRMDLSAGSMDPQFRVYRPDGSLLCSGSTLGGFVETLCSVDTNGTHTLLVGAYNANDTGNYDVYLQRTNNPANPIPIAYDETQSSSISPAVDLDAYTFDASSGDLTLVRMDLSAGSMDPQFRVYRPDGSLLCSGATLGSFVETLCSVDTNGIHTLLVGAYNANATGNYDVYIQRTNNPANPTSIAYGETQSGSISPAVDLDAFTFNGSSSDQLLVRMDLTAGSLDPEFRVFRPDGSLLCSGATLGASVETLCIIDTNGSHTLLTGAYNANATGNYEVVIQQQ